ncbi:MAG: GHKL domain-containing protein [Vallitaleaceae bacterium]|nr:GHKL domain-containing protein [Vallitaleaceae bacterium]
MFWYFVDAFFTLPLLYAIMATMIEFRYGMKRRLFVIVLAIGTTILMDIWLIAQGVDSVELYSHAWITTCIPSFLAFFYLARHRDGRFFFVYLTECVIASIVTFLANILSYFLPWESGFFPVLFHTALLIGILFVCKQLFHRIFFEAAQIQGKLWLLYCVLPLLCIVGWLMYNSTSVYFREANTIINLPYAGMVNLQHLPLMLSMLVVVLYTIYLILIVIRKTHGVETEQREKMMLYFQNRTLEAHLSSIEEKDESMRILRHDLRHHLNTLSGLLQNNAYDKATTYIHQLDHNLMQTKQESFCDNTVLNAVLSYYSESAKKESIPFSIHVKLSGDLPVTDLDMGAALSNLLENAQNACMKQSSDMEKFIDIKFIQHKKQYLLDVSNSYSGEVLFDDDDRPLSAQQDHGIGSQSIYAFSKKYGASLDYSTNNGVFRVSVLFSEFVTLPQY